MTNLFEQLCVKFNRRELKSKYSIRPYWDIIGAFGLNKDGNCFLRLNDVIEEFPLNKLKSVLTVLNERWKLTTNKQLSVNILIYVEDLCCISNTLKKSIDDKDWKLEYKGFVFISCVNLIPDRNLEEFIYNCDMQDKHASEPFYQIGDYIRNKCRNSNLITIPSTIAKIVEYQTKVLLTDENLINDLCGEGTYSKVYNKYKTQANKPKNVESIPSKFYQRANATLWGGQYRGINDPMWFYQTFNGQPIGVEGKYYKDIGRVHNFKDYLQRPGYHFQPQIQDFPFKNVLYVDLHTAYTYSMLTDRFPRGSYCIESDPDKLNCLLYTLETAKSPEAICDRAVMRVQFKNFRVKSGLLIPEDIKKWRIDGTAITDKNRLGITKTRGHLIESTDCSTWITDFDYFTFKNYYEWDSIKILEAYVWYITDRAPLYIRELIKYYYTERNISATDTKSLVSKSFAKQCLERIYGKGLHIRTNSSMWEVFDNDEDYYTATKTRFQSNYLSAIHSIFVAAITRYRMSEIIAKISPKDIIYHDTDCLIIPNTPLYQKIIEDYNNTIRQRGKKMELDEIFMNCGTFRNEVEKLSNGYSNNFSEFKVLSAKRYIGKYRTNTGYDTYFVCCGLHRKDIIAYAKNHNLDLFNDFKAIVKALDSRQSTMLQMI